MSAKFAILALLVLAAVCTASDISLASLTKGNGKNRKMTQTCDDACAFLALTAKNENQEKRIIETCLTGCLAQQLESASPAPAAPAPAGPEPVHISTIAKRPTEHDALADAETESDSDRSTNSAGVNLVKSFEGFRSCVYKDAVGKPTIGYGHLIKSGEHFKCITQAQAETILRRDMGSAEGCVSRNVKRNISDNAFAALVSFTFNLGCGSLQSSTLLKKVNAGASSAEICTQFKRWNKTGGKVLPVRKLVCC